MAPNTSSSKVLSVHAAHAGSPPRQLSRRTVICLIAFAVLGGGAVYAVVKARRGLNELSQHSDSIVAHHYACSYLVHVIDHELPWPDTEEELYIGFVEQEFDGQFGQAFPLFDFISYTPLLPGVLENVSVCDGPFPIQPIYPHLIGCDTRRWYGGSCLETKMNASGAYFHNVRTANTAE